MGRAEGLDGSPELQQLCELAEQHSASLQPIKQAFAEGLLACPVLDPVEHKAAAMAVWHDLQLKPEDAKKALLEHAWTAANGRDVLRLALILQVLSNCSKVGVTWLPGHVQGRSQGSPCDRSSHGVLQYINQKHYWCAKL